MIALFHASCGKQNKAKDAHTENVKLGSGGVMRCIRENQGANTESAHTFNKGGREITEYHPSTSSKGAIEKDFERNKKIA